MSTLSVSLAWCFSTRAKQAARSLGEIDEVFSMFPGTLQIVEDDPAMADDWFAGVSGLDDQHLRWMLRRRPTFGW